MRGFLKDITPRGPYANVYHNGWLKNGMFSNFTSSAFEITKLLDKNVCVCVCVCTCVCVCAQSLSRVWLCHLMDCSTQGSSVHVIFQARIEELGCQALLQRIFGTQGWNPSLLHLLYRQMGSLPLHHLGSWIGWTKSNLFILDSVWQFDQADHNEQIKYFQVIWTCHCRNTRGKSNLI